LIEWAEDCPVELLTIDQGVKRINVSRIQILQLITETPAFDAGLRLSAGLPIWNRQKTDAERCLDDSTMRSYAVVTTTIRLRFDGRSTAYNKPLGSHFRNPLAAVTLMTYFKIYLGRSAAAITWNDRSAVTGQIAAELKSESWL